QLKLRSMEQVPSRAIGKDEQPVVATGGLRPLALPGFGVAEKVHFEKVVCKGLLDRERAEDLERRACREFRVIPRLEQEKTLPVSGAIGRRDAAAVDHEEQQAQPSAVGSASRQIAIEVVNSRIGMNRGPLVVLPTRGLESKRILQRVERIRSTA